MRVLLTVIGAVLLIIMVAGASWALLPPCGLAAPLAALGFTTCENESLHDQRARLEETTRRNFALRQRIAALEHELAVLNCVRQDPVPLTLPEPAETPPQEDPEIDRDAWQSRDVAVLEGCWALDSNFSTTNTNTGVTSRYNSWTMCFDRAGRGQEEMRAANGTTCQGPVSSSFDSAGNLEISEPGNLRCSDGGFIYRMTSNCTLRPDGTANCSVRQPEVGATGSVTFRRAAGDN